MRVGSVSLLSVILVLAVVGRPAFAQRLYPGPPEWWAYMYQGDKANPGAAFTALDGTWDHDNGSDEWDESPIGEGNPGGANALEEGGVTFLRLQDTGDPRDHGRSDPGSNRKLLFGHSITNDIGTAGNAILDEGVTITFRARIPTSGLLDDLHPDGANQTSPYPAGGDGYVPHDGGKDNFNVRQSSGDMLISFALALDSDDDELDTSGLTMNKLNGASASDDVDLQGDEPGTVNILALDPTVWHEFWITIQADDSGTGTHVANIYVDGSMEPDVFYVTAGQGNDYDDSYIGMGVGATPQSGAIDIDFFAYRPGAFKPDGIYKAGSPSPPDGDVTVVLPLFEWSAGATAALHDVYFGTDPNLGPDDLVQSRTPMMLYYHVPGLTPGTTYYWRVDAIEADMTTVHTGDVWTFTAQPFTAYVLSPADGETEVSGDPNLTLTWSPGREAVEHHLYFGSSFDDVNDGTAGADEGTLTETSFVLPQTLGPLATYYWRVDEIAADGTVRTGDVWSFSTFSAVDDFESYDDADNRIYLTWIDGVENGTGSYVGYDVANNGTFGETTIVHSGGQSMPLDYNNVISPHYSETSRTWVAPQNFTAGGANTLVLYVRGSSGSAAEALYVALEDTGMRVHVEVHPDASLATTRKWVRWAIPLSVFSEAGVNVAAVKTMYIGLGDRDAPTPGGAGLIFVDDIRTTLPGMDQ